MAIAVSVWMIIGQVVGSFVFENVLIDYFLRAYVIVLCVLMILAELEVTDLVRTNFLLHNLISRGLVYGFLSVIGIHENETISDARDGHDGLSGIVQAVAWNMLCVAVIYFTMGVFCLQFVLQKCREDYKSRCQRAKVRDEYRKTHPHKDEKHDLDDDLEAQSVEDKANWNHGALDDDKPNQVSVEDATTVQSQSPEVAIDSVPSEDSKKSTSSSVETSQSDKKGEELTKPKPKSESDTPEWVKEDEFKDEWER